MRIATAEGSVDLGVDDSHAAFLAEMLSDGAMNLSILNRSTPPESVTAAPDVHFDTIAYVAHGGHMAVQAA